VAGSARHLQRERSSGGGDDPVAPAGLGRVHGGVDAIDERREALAGSPLADTEGNRHRVGCHPEGRCDAVSDPLGEGHRIVERSVREEDEELLTTPANSKVVVRIPPRSDAATDRRTSSPTACPRRSLIRLKWSISPMAALIGAPDAAACWSSISRPTCPERRFSSPVSASMLAISCRAICCSTRWVMFGAIAT